jgi:hypothetical protein
MKTVGMKTKEGTMATKVRNENRDAKRASAINRECPYCGAALALGVNLAVERAASGEVVGALCAECADPDEPRRTWAIKGERGKKLCRCCKEQKADVKTSQYDLCGACWRDPSNAMVDCRHGR